VPVLTLAQTGALTGGVEAGNSVRSAAEPTDWFSTRWDLLRHQQEQE
jgi:hypothetical protein